MECPYLKTCTFMKKEICGNEGHEECFIYKYYEGLKFEERYF
jgi:hypothetical protein